LSHLGNSRRERSYGVGRHSTDGSQTMSVLCCDVRCRTEGCAFRASPRRRQARTAGSRTRQLRRSLFS
jgi:hypothetical protein